VDNKPSKLQDMLFEALARDLEDPQKCTPGLYQVVRGVVNDNKEEAGSISKENLRAVEEKIASSAPFKFGK
tara:strand:- start:5533 stop:5745 length:213 start_codon:yes stop_codon:yes gene_type:complete